MPRERRTKGAGDLRAACLLVLAGLLAPAACAPRETSSGAGAAESEAALQLQGPAYGTLWHLTVVPQGELDTADLLTEMQAVLERVDARMSTWRADSELSRFADAPAELPFPVSTETALVVTEALRVWQLTDGAFDPTVMPLVDLWGFGPAGRELPAPTEAQLLAALAQVGADKLSVVDDALVKSVDGLALDLSAIAKGYAVDALHDRLHALGQTRFLVEVGGELRTSGEAPGGRPWRVGIDRPATGGTPGTSLQAVIAPDGRSVATSGDYRNVRTLDDGRFSHTIDPRTGRPVEHDLASATVLAPTCMEADAIATALMVLGADAGLALIESLPDVDAFLVLRVEAGYAVLASSGFPEPLED